MNITSLVIYYIERRIILFLSVNELIPFSSLLTGATIILQCTLLTQLCQQGIWFNLKQVF